MSGRFIVLDGIDGCGKSTQIRHLAKWLPNSGLMPATARLVCTCEPGGTLLGRSIRKLLLHNEADHIPSAKAELLLYAADRAQHVDTVISPAIRRGDWVLSDRFVGSTLAYQGYGRGLDRELITNLESIVTSGLEPDLTVLLMVPVAVSMQRRSGKQNDRIESEENAFFHRVADGFAALADQRSWCRLNAQSSIAQLSKELEQTLRQTLQ
ncbi:dTMP kinase [Synechococcus sp. M16CYN]|uniref:dTMP kinase n=1 Tax=Synechococcus sp. M16CYN TaxID=3103139 RepID=UPI0032526A2A